MRPKWPEETGDEMRKRNWRVVSAGALLMALALGFFIVMAGMASRSNDPAGLMRMVGELCGGAGGLSLAMMVFGLLGKRTDDATG